MKVKVTQSNTPAFKVGTEVEYYESLNGNAYLYSTYLVEHVQVGWAERLWGVKFEFED